MPESDKRVALLYPCGNLSNSPPTIILAELLAQNGFNLDVFSVRNINVPIYKFVNSNIKHYIMPITQRRLREPRSVVTAIFMAWVMPVLTKRTYSCIIGSGLRGLIIASVASRYNHIPFVYNCLEFYPYQFNNVWFKLFERYAIRHSTRVIIQDPLRAQFLKEDTHITDDRIVYMPNSTLGLANREESKFLQTRFHIPEDKKIILSAGVFSKNRMMLETTVSAQGWPEEWTLVLHAAQVNDPDYVEGVKAADTANRVVFSLEPVPFQELPALIASAQIGLALYNPMGDANTEYMGMASGKVAQYLRCGKPVVVSDLPGMADLIRRYNCGAVIKEPSELKDALQTVFDDHETMVLNAINCFNTEFSLDRYSGPIIHEFTELLQHVS